MNKQGRVELVVFLLPSRCLAVEAPEHGVLEEAFMDDLLASGGATKLCWRRSSCCVTAGARVVALTCWTGGSHDAQSPPGLCHTP